MTGVVLVLGATGNTGSTVVDELQQLGLTVRPASRSSATRFDWADSATHRIALDGVERIYLVAPVGHPDPVLAVGPFLDRAVAAGVQRVVLLSSSAVSPGDPGLGVVDAAVRNTLPQWEILRPSWFMQNFVERHPLADSIRATGEFVTASGQGRVPFIDARDIGRCAARLLASPHGGNAEHRLTGPQAMCYDDAAEVMTTITGRAVRHRGVDATIYVDFLVESGYDGDFASALAALDERIRDGDEAHVTDAVERLTGEPPRSFADFLRERAGIPR